MQQVATTSVKTTRRSRKAKPVYTDVYNDIGLRLKEIREQRKMSVEQVANRLKIRGLYLRALEEGRFSKIPGQIYVDGYLRSYADYLGMDSAPLVASYRGSGGRPSNDDNYMLPEITHDEMKPGRNILWLALALLMLIYGIWFISDWSREETVQPVPPLATTSPASPQEKVLDARIVIVATSEADITVLGTDGEPLYKDLMHSGETYFVPQDAVILQTSAPGSLQLFVDGENVATKGKSIVTETGILLNPAKLLENSGFKINSSHAVE